MFYGTINASNCTIDTDYAFSNNFTVSRPQDPTTGAYNITFNEYLHYAPSIIATAYSNATGGSATTVEYTMLPSSANEPFQAQFITTELCKNQNNCNFSFHARSGLSLVFDASPNSTLLLNPAIISFGSNAIPVLTLSTDIRGLDSSAQPTRGERYTAYLDKGTELLGVYEGGGTMTLSIPNTVKDSSENTWDLTGWTFGGDAGDDGQQWTPGQSTSSFALSIPGGPAASPMTTPETFVIMATSGGQTLTSDPVVRLSRVSPAGLSI